MANSDFFKALSPIWIIEIVLTGLYHASGPKEAKVLSTILMFISIVLLPFFAGLRVVRFGGTIGLAVLGGVSISAASSLVVGISYIAASADATAFLGFIFASLMFSAVPQAVFGGVGAFIGKKLYSKAT